MIALKTDVLQNKIYPEISFCRLVVAAIIGTCSFNIAAATMNDDGLLFLELWTWFFHIWWKWELQKLQKQKVWVVGITRNSLQY